MGATECPLDSCYDKGYERCCDYSRVTWYHIGSMVKPLESERVILPRRLYNADAQVASPRSPTETVAERSVLPRSARHTAGEPRGETQVGVPQGGPGHRGQDRAGSEERAEADLDRSRFPSTGLERERDPPPGSQ